MIGLLAGPGAYAADSLVACGGLRFGAVPLPGLPVGIKSPNPYGLPPLPGDTAETVLVVSNWLQALEGVSPELPVQALAALRERFQRVVLLEHADPFRLCEPVERLDRADVILKVNGVYRSPELHRWDVGACRADGNWTGPAEPLDCAPEPDVLARLHLCLPTFFSVIPRVRSAVRRFYGRSLPRRRVMDALDAVLAALPRPVDAKRPPRHTAHFYVSLTHVQRADAALRLKRSGLPWLGGITAVPDQVTGIASPEEREAVLTRLREAGLLVPRLDRLRYQRTMADCKAVVSVTGYGELTFRMAEAWANRRVLVCQDLSHARILYPLEPGRNVVYCRPDLSDLADVLEDVETRFSHYAPIAEQGYRDWQAWCSRWRETLREGFAPLYD